MVFLLASSAIAQKPRDKAATKKIDEAINQQYLATNFDKAEGILIGTINACDDKCSPQVLARAWMYLGIVRGSGKNDVAGAQEAFSQAVALDPAVKLDAELATAKTVRAFEAAGGRLPKSQPAPESGPNEPEGAPGLSCTPSARSLGTRYPVPVSCMAKDASRAELFYRPPDGAWKSVAMKKRAGQFQAEVPCSGTASTGTLRVYVRAHTKTDRATGSWGDRDKPIEYRLVDDSSEPPPAWPNQEPPKRCGESEECPPDAPDCHETKKKQRGESCESDDACEAGLTCAEGTCRSKDTCEADSDCTAGKCVDGVCRVPESTAGTSYKRNWFGLHVAEDIAFLGGSDVCSPDSQANNGFVCYYKGSSRLYSGSPAPGKGDNLVSGFAPSTTRFLFSYDRAFSSQFMLGARLGYAINGGPAAANGTKFLPYHVEVRGTYFPLKDSLAKTGFRPYVHLGGGMAQVDAKLVVKAVDCSTVNIPNDVANQQEEVDCARGNPSQAHPTVELDTYKKLGQGFVDFGGGVMFAVSGGVALELNLNGMFMLPSSGAVLEPSFGILFGI